MIHFIMIPQIFIPCNGLHLNSMWKINQFQFDKNKFQWNWMCNESIWWSIILRNLLWYNYIDWNRDTCVLMHQKIIMTNTSPTQYQSEWLSFCCAFEKLSRPRWGSCWKTFRAHKCYRIHDFWKNNNCVRWLVWIWINNSNS